MMGSKAATIAQLTGQLRESERALVRALTELVAVHRITINDARARMGITSPAPTVWTPDPLDPVGSTLDRILEVR